MAHLHACANGNWTAAATWALVDATSLSDSQTGNQALTTTFVSSAAFMPGAITIDGIAIKVASRTTSPTATISVRLAIAGVAVAGTTVTINVSDIPDDVGTAGSSHIGCSIGWVFFKFGANVTLVAATNYTLQVSTSANTHANVFHSGVGGNWSRMLRTTTTQAPVAGDVMFIGGEWTAAATKTDRTVTYNETAATDYGSANINLASIGISKGGTLASAVTASTTYILRLSGLIQNWLEGIVTLGTSGSPMPGTSLLRIEFDCAADGDFGIVNYGSWTDYGSPRTSGKNVVRTLLTADAAVAATGLTVADDTGWLSGDEIAIAPTLTFTGGELRTLTGNAGASSLAVGALTNAHDGDAPNETQADVVLLTRNVRYTTVSSSFYGYAVHRAGTWASAWSEFTYIGTTTPSKSGFTWDNAAAATATFTFCALTRARRIFAYVTAASTTCTFTDCVAWDLGQTQVGGIYEQSSGLAGMLTLTRCTLIGDGAGAARGAFCQGADFVLRIDATNIAGMGSIVVFAQSGATLWMTNSSIYQSNESSGVVFLSTSSTGARIHGSRFWRNGNIINVGVDAEVLDCEFYGNSGYGIQILGNGGQSRIVNCTFNGQTSFASPSAISVSGGSRAALDNCSFGVASGDRIALSAAGIALASVLSYLTLTNCVFNGTQFSGAPAPGSFIAQQDEDGVVATHTTRQYGYGTASIETTVVGDASPSLELAPENAYREFRSPLFTKQINSGQTATFSARVRKTAAYNGNAPRLVLVANGSIGVSTDDVLQTHAAAADTWETLTGAMAAPATQDGVIGVWVACDGTAGSVFVDDVSVVIA